MRVLLISHNSLSKNSNMGRTLLNQFHNFCSDEIAQLYFTDGCPECSYCNEYFCISDMDVIRSIYKRKTAGYELDCNKMEHSQESNEKVQNLVRKKGRRPITYMARNIIWTLGRWKSKELDVWLDKVSPDVIYYASGDYSFSYKVTMYIAKRRNIPVVVGCYDDFYIGKRKTWNPLYYIFYSDLMRMAKRLFATARCFTAVCDTMKEDYEKLFGKPGYTVYTPTELDVSKAEGIREKRIFYAGNLGCGRAEQLAVLGSAIKKLERSDITHIDVYSGEVRDELTALMCEENGIYFHGKVSPEYVKELMLTSKYVIHTESFDEEHKMRVKYSVSTKIADALSSGACIVAFGPKEVASIEYLDRAKAAWVISNREELAEKLTELFENDELSNKVITNALMQSKKNHNNKQNCEHFKSILFDAMEN